MASERSRLPLRPRLPKAQPYHALDAIRVGRDGRYRITLDEWVSVIHVDCVRPFGHNDPSTCCIVHIGFTRATVRHRAFRPEPTIIVRARQPGTGDLADGTPHGTSASDSEIVLSAQVRSVAENGTEGTVRVVVRSRLLLASQICTEQREITTSARTSHGPYSRIHCGPNGCQSYRCDVSTSLPFAFLLNARDLVHAGVRIRWPRQRVTA